MKRIRKKLIFEDNRRLQEFNCQNQERLERIAQQNIDRIQRQKQDEENGVLRMNQRITYDEDEDEEK